MGGSARPLRVWLVEHNDPFALAPQGEAATVRNGLRERLLGWFLRVLRHADARNVPTGYRRAAEVKWTDLASPGQVGDRDIVVYFSPHPNSTPTPPAQPQSVRAGPYQTAVRQLPNSEAAIRTALLGSIASSAAGGHTLRVKQDDWLVPLLSEVYVLYDAQDSNQRMRVEKNVEKLAVAAFHEAGHGKADRLHEDGGGGVFQAAYVGQQLSNANIAFLAGHIWDWSPQYLRGQPVTPVRSP
jgi:hypothetical protein